MTKMPGGGCRILALGRGIWRNAVERRRTPAFVATDKRRLSRELGAEMEVETEAKCVLYRWTTNSLSNIQRSRLMGVYDFRCTAKIPIRIV
ncbi:hypothetical protein ACLOJK_012755 [Asimina triloba]